MSINVHNEINNRRASCQQDSSIVFQSNLRLSKTMGKVQAKTLKEEEEFIPMDE